MVCERCRRRKERRQRYRLQPSFLISATAASALQPRCASEPGAWKRSEGSAQELLKCFGDQREPREQLQPGKSCVHVLFPCHSSNRPQQGLGGSSGPLCQLGALPL